MRANVGRWNARGVRGLTRRQALAALGAGALAGMHRPSHAAAADELSRHKIAGVTGFHVSAPRPKFVGKNSHLDDHGDHTHDDVLILTTDQGARGFGSGRLDREAAKTLLGQTVSALWTDGAGSTGTLRRQDHALFDLVGKILGKPAWSLIGSEGVEAVPVYDGSIYFNDLRTGYKQDGVPRLIEEVEQGLERGFRAFKIKVGRGYKWMPKEEGFARDVEVVSAIRRRVGPDVRLMVDANNGFTPDEANRWLDAVSENNLFFVEEMFPESIADDTALREYIHSKGWKTLIADGESAGELDYFDPYLKAGCIDVVQPDVRAFGLSLEWAMSRRIAELQPRARLAPHNWGSHLGGFMQLVLGRALPNILMAEIDTSRCELFDASAFTWSDGKIRVPDTPGFGLVLDDELFRAKYAGEAWSVKA
jgi:L-alanine-DL-glutamate epimerase-like enolase superfamily enzyme